MANVVLDASAATALAGVTKGLAVAGDIKIDTVTSAGLVFIDDFATEFSTAREDATIWVNGATIGTVYNFWLENGGTPIGFGQNRLVVYGGQLNVSVNASTNSGQTFVLKDFDGLYIHGEFMQAYPGMAHGMKRFMQGTFGIWIHTSTAAVSGNIGNLQLSFSIEDNGFYGGDGIEVSGGFAAISAQQNGVAGQVNTATFRRCYIHDAYNGEGMYMGETTGADRPESQNIKYQDCLIARGATEDSQWSVFTAGSEESAIEQSVFVQSATAWKNAFQANQDGHFQFIYAEGKTRISRNIMDGGNYHSKFFSTAAGTPNGTDYILMNRNLIMNFNERAVYFGSDTTENIPFIFNGNFFLLKGNKQEQQGYAATTELVDDDGDPTKRMYVNNKWDGTVGSLATSGSDTGSQKILNGTASLATPSFVCSGFLIGEQPAIWFDEYGSYTPESGTKTAWALGDIMIDARVGVARKFYKVTTAHSSDGTTPPTNPNVIVLTWDTDGIRNDMVGHNSGSAQSFEPPDYWALVADDVYNLLRIGSYSNEYNTNGTIIQWFRATSPNPVEADLKRIPGASLVDYTPTETDRGYYVLAGIKRKNINGTYGTWAYPAAAVLVG